MALARAGVAYTHCPCGVELVKRRCPRGCWFPAPGPQTRFCASTAREALFGGAAGGGKSAALVALPLQWVHRPKFRALILRRDSTQLADLLDKASFLYPRAVPGVRHNKAENRYYFPSGAQVWFTHCEHADDYKRFDGHEYQLIAPDELTHFTEEQFLKITARLRTSDPELPLLIRPTTNPGGEGHEWVYRRWGPWLDPDYDAAKLGLPERFDEDGKRLPPAKPGQVLFYLPTEDGEKWTHKGDFFLDEESGAKVFARSRTFIPSKLADNPYVDPEYRGQLMGLDPVRRKQLLHGDWLARAARGELFKRHWFTPVDAAPAEVIARVRYWDRAATEEPRPGEAPPASKGKKKNSNDPDWTVGFKMSVTKEGLFVVEHVTRARLGPGGVEQMIKTTAEQDAVEDPNIVQVLEWDPGSAGKFEASYYISALVGINVVAVRPTTDKVARARPASAQAAPPAQNFRMVRGPWNKPLLDEVEEFPEGGHDDQVDGLSGAFGVLYKALLKHRAQREKPQRRMQSRPGAAPE